MYKRPGIKMGILITNLIA